MFPQKSKKVINKMDILLMPSSKDIEISRGVGNIAKFTSPLKLFDYLPQANLLLPVI